MPNQTNKLKPVHMLVFPTAGSLNEAMENMQAIVPEEYWNDVYVSLMVYHNTLIKELS